MDLLEMISAGEVVQFHHSRSLRSMALAEEEEEEISGVAPDFPQAMEGEVGEDLVARELLLPLLGQGYLEGLSEGQEAEMEQQQQQEEEESESVVIPSPPPLVLPQTEIPSDFSSLVPTAAAATAAAVPRNRNSNRATTTAAYSKRQHQQHQKAAASQQQRQISPPSSPVKTVTIRYETLQHETGRNR